MDNQYIKTYPELMVDKTIMYVHGFGSAASTNTVKVLQTLLPNAHVIAEDLPISPAETMELLHALCDQHKPDLIIGTSMGGMYTEMLRGYDRILVNPAFNMGDTMAEHNMMGKQVFQNPRKDGVQEFIVTKALVKEYREMTTHNFLDLDDEEKGRVWGLFGDEDPVVHTFDIFREHYPQAIHFHGEHRLTEKVIHHALIPLIRQIDDKQEGRERPVVYITMNAMKDSYGKPKSCLQKAYEMLLQFYDIYIVAPSLINDPQLMAADQAWVEQYLSSPAWGKTIFCNRSSLLLGDYIIDTKEHPDFMGTGILLGSDEFKTWEEVITYFSLLGGQ